MYRYYWPGARSRQIQQAEMRAGFVARGGDRHRNARATFVLVLSAQKDTLSADLFFVSIQYWHIYRRNLSVWSVQTSVFFLQLSC